MLQCKNSDNLESLPWLISAAEGPKLKLFFCWAFLARSVCLSSFPVSISEMVTARIRQKLESCCWSKLDTKELRLGTSSSRIISYKRHRQNNSHAQFIWDSMCHSTAFPQEWSLVSRPLRFKSQLRNLQLCNLKSRNLSLCFLICQTELIYLTGLVWGSNPLSATICILYLCSYVPFWLKKKSLPFKFYEWETARDVLFLRHKIF